MKISIVSLGCSKNLVDSELILGSLKEAGHTISSQQEAEVIIVNTCGFIADATKESVDTIVDLAELKREGKLKKLIVTGCLVERYKDELKREIPEVDAFWGTGSLFKIPELLKEETAGLEYTSSPGALYDPDSPREMLTLPHTAFVKVSEGCSRTCSFCIIPQLRGRMKSRTVASVVGEASLLAARGVREINLIAQDMTAYGRDIDTDLETLLRGLASVDEIMWIRLHYCYPWGFTESLLDLIAAEEKILNYIDMPLQHINDRILKAMDRGTSQKLIRAVIQKLRTQLPALTLRTTFIAGFPGETEEEFSELLDFAQETEFDRLGVFKYSHEKGTKAGELVDNVSEEEKEARVERLLEMQASVSFNKNQALIGTVHDSFVEGREDEHYLTRIHTQAPEVDGYTLLQTDRDFQPGDLVRLRITEVDIYDLYAEPV